MMRTILLCLIPCLIAGLVVAGCGGGGSSSESSGNLTITGAASSEAALPLQLATGALAALPSFNPPPAGGSTGWDPDSVLIYFEQLWLGQKADCTDLALAVDKGGAADYQELMTNPTLIDSSVDAGTYECLAIKMRDIIYFTPNAAASSSIEVCDEKEYGHDILKAFDTPESWYDPELDDVTLAEGDFASAVSGSVSQDVFVYFTTDYSGDGDTVTSSALDANGLLHPHQLLHLVSPVVVETGSNTQKLFYFDFRNQVVDDSGYCTLDAPDIGFK